MFVEREGKSGWIYMIYYGSRAVPRCRVGIIYAVHNHNDFPLFSVLVLVMCEGSFSKRIDVYVM